MVNRVLDNAAMTNIYQLFALAAIEFPERAQKWMPQWFLEHPAFKDYKSDKVIKVFEKFGISDFREVVESTVGIESFKELIRQNLATAFRELEIKNAISKRQLNPDESLPEKKSLEEVTYELTKQVFSDQLWNQPRHKLIAQIMSSDKKIRLDAGTSIIKAYNTLRQKLEKYNVMLPSLESSAAFKEYNKRGTVTVVFSTAPEDIAAMSSRSEWGSCQSLTDPEGNPAAKTTFNGCVVGSTLSKFVGVCYLTTEKHFLNRGEEMIARCLVRFVIDVNVKRPVIYLDKMHPGYVQNYASVMKEALQKRTQVPVVDSTQLQSTDIFKKPYRIPKEEIKNLNEWEESYIDTLNLIRPHSEIKKIKAPSEDEKVTDPIKFFQEFMSEFSIHLRYKIFAWLNDQIRLKQMYDKFSQVFIEEDLEMEATTLSNRIVNSLVREIANKIANYYDKESTTKNKNYISRRLLLKTVHKHILSDDKKDEITYTLKQFNKSESHSFTSELFAAHPALIKLFTNQMYLELFSIFT